MSALAHYLEEDGIASVAIALIRPQAENTRPPRALWVPFELGRPIGPPSDAAFQKLVILAALGLLETKKHTSLIVDFPDDDPREAPDPKWRPPVSSAAAPEGPAENAEAVEAELRSLAPAYAASCTAHERSTVGLSGLPPAACGEYLAAWLRGERPASPVADMSPALALRFAIDDLKAFALEAALPAGTKPSSKQLGDWLWNNTALGAALKVLRQNCLAGDDERLKAVAAFFVPALRVPAG
ncbi:MAG: hypothetical protein WA459_20330 [Stellaceae bacterium]